MVRRVVRSIPGRQVGTVGRIAAYPGAPNVIPGKVVLSLELRDLSSEKIKTSLPPFNKKLLKLGNKPTPALPLPP